MRKHFQICMSIGFQAIRHYKYTKFILIIKSGRCQSPAYGSRGKTDLSHLRHPLLTYEREAPISFTGIKKDTRKQKRYTIGTRVLKKIPVEWGVFPLKWWVLKKIPVREWGVGVARVLSDRRWTALQGEGNRKKLVFDLEIREKISTLHAVSFLELLYN